MYKLLICEDEMLERKALKLMIQNNYSNIQFVKDATNGSEAIEHANQFRPDIILMDISMPLTNGLEAQKEIIKFLPNVKTIIISAYDDFSFAQEAIKYGVFDYLLKPVSPKVLSNCLNKLMKTMDITTYSENITYTGNIQKIIEYIDLNYLDNNLNLKSLSNRFGLNEKYLSRYFKEKMEISYTEYVTKLKMERAKYLLKYTDNPIYEISVELNYSDSSYFSKLFKKTFGVSPSEYRNNN